ncbi:MAG: FliH/SctL family protein [Dehalococcoidia bacterium]
MSSPASSGPAPHVAPTGLLRAPRRGEAVRLGIDGRPEPDLALLAGLGEATLGETAEAASIVERAHERADELVRHAALAAADVEQQAYEEGHVAGTRAGIAEGRAQLAEALALVQRAAAEAKAMRDRLYESAEPAIVELVIATTRSVIGERIATDPSVVHETVRRALARAGSQNVMRLRVAPGEQAAVQAHLDEERGEALPFAVVADGAVTVGGCLVDTGAGRVDARLDVQLEEVARLLRASAPRPTDRPADQGEATDAS